MKQYVSKRFEFAYPDEKGETKIIGCTLLAEQEEAENFDKFWNVLRSMIKATNMKELKIYDFGKEL